MTEPRFLHGYRWRPAWEWQVDESGRRHARWTGLEYLYDAGDRQVFDGPGFRSGPAIWRKAPVPDYPPPADRAGTRVTRRRR